MSKDSNTDLTRSAIRKAILEMEKPFCKVDLLSRLQKQGFENKGLIIEIFNEMFEEGLIKYERITDRENEVLPNDGWAFKIA